MYQVDNAVILAAGAASRFAPVSRERHKGLIQVRGEVLIERQIRQLRQAGVPQIYVVTGYHAAQFAYLEQRFGVKLIHNEAYRERNNHSSIYAARDVLKNSYICSADNYFAENPFEREVEESYYAGVYAQGQTREWCMETDEAGWITRVQVGGADAWYMLGHAFWSEPFTKTMLQCLEAVYHHPETASMFWEDVFIRNIDRLPMKLRKYPAGVIHEFDSLDELREFDGSYRRDARCKVMEDLAQQLGCGQEELVQITGYTGGDACGAGFHFTFRGQRYDYAYDDPRPRRIHQ